MNTVRVYLLLAVTAALSCCVKSQYEDIIQTTLGRLIGTKVTIQVLNAGAINVDVFWGIPYAKPPIGDLRFKAPNASVSWEGLRYAITPPNTCFQVRGSGSILTGSQPPSPLSEDCLYLNIWRPRCSSGDQNMAVMFWVHGGSFMAGSTADPVYNGATLAATECVIVVSVNYRLGPFGFMFYRNKTPGNMGLLDVELALRWVKDNVANFSGNPAKITLFGQGAGGTIVTLFLMSPSTRDLFNNAIIQGGSPLIKFNFQKRNSSRSATTKLVYAVNCNNTNSREIFPCLKALSAEIIVQKHAELSRNPTYSMVPMRHFLERTPYSTLTMQDVKRCDILIGSTKREETIILRNAMPQQFNFSNHSPPTMHRGAVIPTLNILFRMVFKPEYISNITDSVKTLYNVGTGSVDSPSLTFLQQVVRDILFVCPANFLAKTYSTLSRKAYVYRYDYISENTILPAWVGATHGSEVPLEFRTTTPVVSEISSRDAQMSEKIMKLWANFARSGNPTPVDETTTTTWSEYANDDPSIMVFREDATLESTAFETRYCNYWNSIPIEYFS